MIPYPISAFFLVMKAGSTCWKLPSKATKEEEEVEEEIQEATTSPAAAVVAVL